jgi:molybdopterin converting factor small subunit
MAQVHFTSNLRRHVDCPSMVAEGRTVRAVLDVVFAEHPRLETYILDDQRALRKHMRILVNGRVISDLQKQSDAVQPDDEVWVMQALSGG